MFPRIRRYRVEALLTLVAIVIGLVGWGYTESQASEKKQRGWLGVSLQEMTPSLRDAMDLGDQTGLLVTDVVRHSPADDAGIREEDVIVEFNGKKVERAKELAKLVRRTEPRKKVKVVIIRDGKRKELEVTIGKSRRKLSKSWSWSGGPGMMFFGGRPRLGVQVHELDEDLASYFKVEAHGGALVLEVVDDSPAEQAGLRVGDVITKVDEEVIRDPDDLIETLEDYEDGDVVQLEYVRKGNKEQVEVELENGGPGPFRYYGPGREQLRILRFGDDCWDKAVIMAPRILDDLRIEAEIRDHQQDRLQDELKNLNERHAFQRQQVI